MRFGHVRLHGTDHSVVLLEDARDARVARVVLSLELVEPVESVVLVNDDDERDAVAVRLA